MSLDEVKRKIMDLAKRRAEEVRKAAAGRAGEISMENDERIKTMLISGRERYAESAALKKDRMVGVARVEARNRHLNVKQEIIEEVINETLNSILALPDGEYLGLMEKLFASADIPGGDWVVQISRADAGRVTTEFLRTVEERLSKGGKNVSLALSDTRRDDIRGGFVIASGHMEIDCSIDAVIRMRRDEMEREAAQILFGG